MNEKDKGLFSPLHLQKNCRFHDNLTKNYIFSRTFALMFSIKNLKNVQNRPQNIYTEKSFTNEIQNTLYSTLVNILT